MRVLFVSHSELGSNSAYHVLSLAAALEAEGVQCRVCVPGETPSDAPPGLFVVGFEEALRSEVLSGSGVDLIHAWTPREHVRSQTLALSERLGAPYLVHMEDNEEQIISDVLHWRGVHAPEALSDDDLGAVLGPRRSHPARFRDFLGNAVGYSCLIDALLAWSPGGRPSAVFWPGHDPAFSAEPRFRDEAARTELGISPDELMVFYPGNTHRSNVQDVRDLYGAINLARGWGVPVRLVRTGVNHAALHLTETLDPGPVAIELGYVPRAQVIRLMSAADILVQPGRPGPFNDPRFPSKVPEFLVSGRPVVLSASNIGRVLKNGAEAWVLPHGTIDEMAEALRDLWRAPETRLRLGEGGRAFAEKNLRWEGAARTLAELYLLISGEDAPV